MKVGSRVALVGSSGGGAATLGHTDPFQLLQTIHSELLKVENGAALTHALFVSSLSGAGFDAADVTKDVASLYSVEAQSTIDPANLSRIHVEHVQTDVLSKVNRTCRAMDLKVAEAIRSNKIQGLILVSVDIDIHSETLKAAAESRIPITGSGGTSLSAAVAKFGIRLAGNAGGSVATTSYTRAISYTYALATEWRLSYHPFSNVKTRTPQWKSVLNSCLPAFWAVCLSVRTIKQIIGALDNDATVIASTLHELSHLLQTRVLPTVCCVVMATSSAPEHGSVVAMAASISAAACSESILAGLLAGWIVAFLVGRVLFQCIVWRIPGTMTNLVVAGGVGTSVAIGVFPVVPFLRQGTMWIRRSILTSMDGRIPGVGFLLGCLFCYGSKVGYYHAFCLPVILVEMELGGASVWGAMDECTLVLVSAGICFANLLLLPWTDKSDRELCRRAVFINLLCGDFIEAAYPFMEQSALVNAAGYLASGLSVEILTGGDPQNIKSLAYLPLPASIWLADDSKRMAKACATAFGVSFAGAFLHNILVRRRNSKKDSKQARRRRTTKRFC